MIDIVTLAPGESIVLDTTNNTVSIVLLNTANVKIVNQENIEYAKLQSSLEIFTLAINTGVYTAINNATNDAQILIIREFIY